MAGLWRCCGEGEAVRRSNVRDRRVGGCGSVGRPATTEASRDAAIRSRLKADHQRLRLLSVAAGADHLAAARAAGAVLFGDGFAEIHAGDIGNCCEPGEHIGKFCR